MKPTVLLSITATFLTVGASAAFAQERIYRCSAKVGNVPEYINNAKEAQLRGCKQIEGGNVTVVQGTQPSRNVVRVASATTTSPATPRAASDNGEQRARDSDSRAILEAELKKAEAKLAEQQKEYNNGEPEKQGIEGRNYQRYLDRVAEMKESIARNESDIAGLKREIARLPGSVARQ
ncbi:MAG TPA: hypothetical protein VE934_10770 [Polaromonas sp.]|uniref:hypothetical protein n=1 Tax=Polaromonas sp. TaxID=1869339 RepID=UPI002D70A098|nr:hypothetical protein [Polaromonas sp.]HYW57436.1 hypothetical protein [Polaromonas sp.]